MKVVFKCIAGLAFLFLYIHLTANSQYHNKSDYSPEKLLAESKALEEKANFALIKASLYQQEGSLFLDSARIFNNMIKSEPNTNNIRLFVKQLEIHYTLAYKYIAMADSMAILAANYREEAGNKTKEAYAMMGKDVEITYNHSVQSIQNVDIQKNTSTYMASNEQASPKNVKASAPASMRKIVNKTNSTLTPSENKSDMTSTEILFIVQLGAGNMNMNYFSKVPDIKTVNCKDGIVRYVLPTYYSKNEAYKKKEELIKIGYEQIFIRTKESLDKISN